MSCQRNWHFFSACGFGYEYWMLRIALFKLRRIGIAYFVLVVALPTKYGKEIVVMLRRCRINPYRWSYCASITCCFFTVRHSILLYAALFINFANSKQAMSNRLQFPNNNISKLVKIFHCTLGRMRPKRLSSKSL